MPGAEGPSRVNLDHDFILLRDIDLPGGFYDQPFSDAVGLEIGLPGTGPVFFGKGPGFQGEFEGPGIHFLKGGEVGIDLLYEAGFSLLRGEIPHHPHQGAFFGVGFKVLELDSVARGLDEKVPHGVGKLSRHYC